MKTTKRFENAIMKLYKAFHENELNAFDCSACAVGNICDNNWQWAHIRILNTYTHSVIDKHNKDYKLGINVIKNSNYSVTEIIKIENLFLSYFKEDRSDAGDKELQFKGLCAVVEYLAKLDNIPNPMDYSKLFETQNDKPIYELNEVF